MIIRVRQEKHPHQQATQERHPISSGIQPRQEGEGKDKDKGCDTQKDERKTQKEESGTAIKSNQIK